MIKSNHINKIINVTLITLTVLIFCSCSQDNIEPNVTNKNFFELENSIVLKNSTSYVTDLFLNMGVTNINVSTIHNSTLFEFETQKSFKMNGDWIDMTQYPIIFKDGVIALKNKPTISLTIVDNSPYVVRDDIQKSLPNEDYFQNKEHNILLLFMNEIITNSAQKIDANLIYQESFQKSWGCSIWDQWDVIAFGSSRSVSAANLETSIALDSDIEGCRKVGSAETSCLLGNHGCISTQSYCCDGYSPIDESIVE